MGRKYYVMMERDPQNGNWRSGGDWSQEFGDYDKSCVQDEISDRRDHGVRAKDLRILTVNDDTQAAIAAAVQEFRQKISASA